MTEREIFLRALDMDTPEARVAYLREACDPDVSLRRKVEELLREHFGNDSLLAGPAVEGARHQVESCQAPAAMLDRYRLLEKIGEGGFGEVWMAEQREPIKRRVALKIIKPGMDSRQIVARFEVERQALAMMDHPNIAKIFDAGTTDPSDSSSSGRESAQTASDASQSRFMSAATISAGRPYFVMELVRGVKITEYCDQNQLSTKERLNLFIKVCQAIQHAHQKGIIHRDIKPSNILVTLHDGVPVPKVIDFGIAKATQQELTDETVFTQFQQFMGTPAYISPEQAEMSGLDIDTRADIYSLGVLLYELLVGQTPFDAKEMMRGGLDVLRQTIREKEPLRPSTKLNTLQADARTTAGQHRQTEVGRLVHQLRGDLDWIVMKCLEKDRQRRYETASGLAADLKRYLNQEPVVARPPSTAYRFQKLLRRNKVMSAATALVLAAIIAGTVISITQATRAQRELRRALAAETQAQREKANAQAAERDAHQQLYAALFEQARATVRSGEMGHRVNALDALRRAAAISNSAELRREVFAALALPDLRFERELPYGEEFTERNLDPAFERIALGRGNGPVEIRSVADGRLLATLAASTNLPAYVSAWSVDGHFLAIKRDYPGGGLRSDREIWELPLGAEAEASVRRILVLKDVPRDAVALHPRLPRVLVGRNTEAVIRDLTGDEIVSVRLPGTPSRLRFSPDGKRFAALCAVGRAWQLSVHDIANGALLTFHDFGVNHANFNWHPDGRWLAVGDNSGQVHAMDAQTGETRELGRHKAEAVGVEFSPEGAWLTSGGWDRELICWDARTRQRAFTIRLNGAVGRFSADGRRYAVSTRSAVRLHTFEKPGGYREFAEDLGTRLRHAAFSPDGRWLAASGEKRLGVWDLTANTSGAVDAQAHDAHVFFTTDGRELFGCRSRGLGNNAPFRWRITPATSVDEPPRLERLALPRLAGFSFLSLHSNSVLVTTTNGTQLLEPEEIETGRKDWQRTPVGPSRASPDGRWLGVFQNYTPTLHVYRLPELEPVARLTQLPGLGNINDFEFSPAGGEVALYSSRGVELWSTDTWKRTRALSNFTRPFHYAPDGRSYWLTKDLRAAGLYDARTLEPLSLLPIGMLPLAVSADGRHLAVSVEAQRLQVWDLAQVRERFRELGLDWAQE